LIAQSSEVGRKKVEETIAGAASNYRDGDVTGVDLIAKYVSDGLACVVEVERGKSSEGTLRSAGAIKRLHWLCV
jgi:hypothetical protein